jgi:hypothetical protein
MAYIQNFYHNANIIADNTGQIGIGTLTPEAKLDVDGGIKIQNGENLEWGGTYANGWPTIYASSNYIVMAPTGTGGVASRSLKINATGVGIGADPTEKLHVGGNVRIAPTGSALVFDTTGANGSNGIKTINNYESVLFNGRGAAGFAVIGNSEIRLGFGTNYTAAESDLMITHTSGFVGIGGNTPSYLFDVRKGTVSGAIARFSAINAHVIIESSSAGPAVLHFKPNATGNKSGQFKVTAGSGYNFRWSNDAAGTSEVSYMTLDTSTTGGGDLTVKGDVIAYGAPSDRKYKENIKPIESALDKAMHLQGVTFDWKDSESILDIKEDIGFIAQDVEKVLPELVRDSGKGNLSLRYQGITPILLEAIKELKAEIEDLKKKIK